MFSRLVNAFVTGLGGEESDPNCVCHFHFGPFELYELHVVLISVVAILSHGVTTLGDNNKSHMCISCNLCH